METGLARCVQGDFSSEIQKFNDEQAREWPDVVLMRGIYVFELPSPSESPGCLGAEGLVTFEQ